VEDEEKNMLKEVVVACFNVHVQHLRGMTEEYRYITSVVTVGRKVEM
jgi:hypothetical protein